MRKIFSCVNIAFGALADVLDAMKMFFCRSVTTGMINFHVFFFINKLLDDYTILMQGQVSRF